MSYWAFRGARAIAPKSQNNPVVVRRDKKDEKEEEEDIEGSLNPGVAILPLLVSSALLEGDDEKKERDIIVSEKAKELPVMRGAIEKRMPQSFHLQESDWIEFGKESGSAQTTEAARHLVEGACKIAGDVAVQEVLLQNETFRDLVSYTAHSLSQGQPMEENVHEQVEAVLCSFCGSQMAAQGERNEIASHSTQPSAEGVGLTPENLHKNGSNPIVAPLIGLVALCFIGCVVFKFGQTANFTKADFSQWGKLLVCSGVEHFFQHATGKV